jgi:hypothetical protein
LWTATGTPKTASIRRQTANKWRKTANVVPEFAVKKSLLLPQLLPIVCNKKAHTHQNDSRRAALRFLGSIHRALTKLLCVLGVLM